MWKELVMTYFKVLSLNFPGGGGGIKEIGIILKPRFVSWTSRRVDTSSIDIENENS